MFHTQRNPFKLKYNVYFSNIYTLPLLNDSISNIHLICNKYSFLLVSGDIFSDIPSTIIDKK